MIILFIRINLSFNYVQILLGEIWCWPFENYCTFMCYFSWIYWTNLILIIPSRKKNFYARNFDQQGWIQQNIDSLGSGFLFLLFFKHSNNTVPETIVTMKSLGLHAHVMKNVTNFVLCTRCMIRPGDGIGLLCRTVSNKVIIAGDRALASNHSTCYW